MSISVWRRLKTILQQLANVVVLTARQDERLIASGAWIDWSNLRDTARGTATPLPPSFCPASQSVSLSTCGRRTILGTASGCTRRGAVAAVATEQDRAPIQQ